MNYKGRCPYCNFREYGDDANKTICTHIAKKHQHMLGEMSPAQAHYMYRNKGKQPVCHLSGCDKICEWDDKLEKPTHYCSEECRVTAGMRAKNNGAKQDMTDPEVQYKCQDNRGISGTKEYSDRSSAPYMGKAELLCLDVLFKEFRLTGKNIRRPLKEQCFEYRFKGIMKQYLPDYSLFEFNCLIEVKEPLGNKNMHPAMVEQRKMNAFKEKRVKEVKTCHYLRFHEDDIPGFIKAMKRVIALKGRLTANPVFYAPEGYFDK